VRYPMLCLLPMLAVLMGPDIEVVRGQALSERPDPVKEDNALLTETVGLLTGLQLYQTYLNIGLLADARAEGLYEPLTVAQLLGSAAAPLDKVDAQLGKIEKLKLAKEDAQAITRLRKIAGLLRTQSKELAAFWDTGKDEHGKKYETARQAAWKELNFLLDLEATDAKLPNPREVPGQKK